MLASRPSRLGLMVWRILLSLGRGICFGISESFQPRLGSLSSQSAETCAKTTMHSLPPSNPLVAGASKLGSGGKGQYVPLRGFFPPAARLEVLRSRLAGN